MSELGFADDVWRKIFGDFCRSVEKNRSNKKSF